MKTTHVNSKTQIDLFVNSLFTCSWLSGFSFLSKKNRKLDVQQDIFMLSVPHCVVGFVKTFNFIAIIILEVQVVILLCVSAIAVRGSVPGEL